MVNKIISAIVLGVLIYIWWYAGTMVPWVNDGSYKVNGAVLAVDGAVREMIFPGAIYLFFSILTFVLACCKK